MKGKHKIVRAGLLLLVIISILIDFLFAWRFESTKIYELNFLIVYLGWYSTFFIILVFIILISYLFKKLGEDMDKSIKNRYDEFFGFFFICFLVFIITTSLFALHITISTEIEYQEEKQEIEKEIGKEIDIQEMYIMLESRGEIYESKEDKLIQFLKFKFDTIKLILFALLSFIVYQHCFEFRESKKNGKNKRNIKKILKS